MIYNAQEKIKKNKELMRKSEICLEFKTLINNNS